MFLKKLWLDILASRSWDRNPVDSNANIYIYIYINFFLKTRYIYTVFLKKMILRNENPYSKYVYRERFLVHLIFIKKYTLCHFENYNAKLSQ